MTLDRDLQRKVDVLWDKFWAGGLANPLTAIDQMNYLIFLRRIEDLDDLAVRRAVARAQQHVSVFEGVDDSRRWSFFRNLPAEEMLEHIQSVVFPWFKTLGSDAHSFTSYLNDAVFLISKPSLLVEAINVIDDLAITDRNVDTQGDIYEHMLGKLGVAGQIGQFRTPRHVIRTMVRMVDPAIGERVLDPACGTAGFLIATYQWIVEKGTSPDLLTEEVGAAPSGLVGDRLSDEQWAWLKDPAFFGSDFDASMVRIAAMNMVLHGIEHPRIRYADALGKTYDHSARADVVLANPPFSGAVNRSDVSDAFRTETGKTELLFLQLFQDVLAPGGRAAVIVPEGVLRGVDRASIEIRRRLVEDYHLAAVIALPHWTFKPYASVATGILVFGKAKPGDRVWMYRVQNDGFSQGLTKVPIDENDLPDLLARWGERNDPDAYAPENGKHGWVSLDTVRDAEYDLSPNFYLRVGREVSRFPMARIRDVCTLSKGRIGAATATGGQYPLITTSEEPRSHSEYHFDGEAVCIPLVSSTGHGHASIKWIHYVSGRFAAATIVAVLQVKDPANLLPRFLHYYLETMKDELLVPLMMGSANKSLSLTKIGNVEIPVPPPTAQRELIESLVEIDADIADVRNRGTALKDSRTLALELFRGTLHEHDL